jgi:hypothetical protein
MGSGRRYDRCIDNYELAFIGVYSRLKKRTEVFNRE